MLTSIKLLRPASRASDFFSLEPNAQGLCRLFGHPIVISEDNISIDGNRFGWRQPEMTALISTLKTRLFARVRPEDRVHALSVYSALIFIALVVVATFPHHQTF
jgi:hypothetical protein